MRYLIKVKGRMEDDLPPFRRGQVVRAADGGLALLISPPN